MRQEQGDNGQTARASVLTQNTAMRAELASQRQPQS